jgi:MipA family protein
MQLIKKHFTKRVYTSVIAIAIQLMSFGSFAATESESPEFNDSIPDHIVGDIGVAVYSTNLHIGSYGTQTAPLPYGFFDYQRFAMRIDQLALKTVQMGYGHLELVGKLDYDTYKVKSIINGQTINKGYQVPIGIGTFQETPLGVFMLNAYHDFGPSSGNLLEFNYYGEIETVKQVVVYPQAGVERQTSQYANYYYGLTSAQAVQTGYAPYTASGSTNPFAGLLIEVPVIEDWYLNIYGKRKWLGSGVNNSPVLTRSFQDTMFVSLAYRFK